MSAAVKTIRDFIEFCRDVGDRANRLEVFDHKKPFWVSGLAKFHDNFEQDSVAFAQIFERFINDNRRNLETPIFGSDGKPNDKWLKIGKASTEDGEGWTRKSKSPRGIVIWLNPENEKLSVIFLPVSEVYQTCLAMYHAKVNLKYTHHENIPVTFLLKFFQCLDAVEANNHYFEQNIVDAQDELGSDSEDADEKVEASPEQALEKQATGMMAFMQNFKPENMGALLQQASSNPMIRMMAKNVTGLEGESLDKLFAEAPIMLSSVQASIMTGPAVKTILEQESIQEILVKNPSIAGVVQSIAGGAAPAITTDAAPAIAEGAAAESVGASDQAAEEQD